MKYHVDRKWLEVFFVVVVHLLFFFFKRLIHCFVKEEIIEYRNNN